MLCAAAVDAQAQDAPTLRPHRVIVSGGVTWSGGYAIGDTTAQLRGNATGASAPPFTLFTAASELVSATGVEAHVGFSLTPGLVIEGGASFAAPHVAIAIASDPESQPQRLEGERLQQYFFDAAVLWHLPMRAGTRARPFIIGGGGYLRQLHEERTLVETGRIVYIGGGARYWIRGGRGTTRQLGLRGDVRANVRSGGIDFEDKVRIFPTLAIQLFVGL